MSYVRPFIFQPKDLQTSAQDTWLHHVFRLIRINSVISYHQTPRSPSYDDIYDDPQGYDDSRQHSSRVSDLFSRSFRHYLDTTLPVIIQEECFHRGSHLIRSEEFHSTDLFPEFFKSFWRPEFRFLNVLPVWHRNDRIFIFDHLLSLESQNKTEIAKFRLFEGQSTLDIEESYLTKRLLRGLSNLRHLVLWKVCDDTMLQIIGTTCNHLEALDVWKSKCVTDVGLKNLLSIGSAENIPAIRSSLRRVVIKETSCTHIGAICLLNHCHHLEVLDFSHGIVARQFLTSMRDQFIKNGTVCQLKTIFLPVTNSEILSDLLEAFPNLIELSLWSSVQRLSNIRSCHFPKLKNLMMGGIHSNQLLSDVLQVQGSKLTTLKLETVLTTLIPIAFVGRTCPNLTELQVINARISIENGLDAAHVGAGPIFKKLKLVYFFLVEYIKEDNHSSSITTGLHFVLSHANSLEGIQATGSKSLDDKSLQHILTTNYLSKLRRFILTDNLSTVTSNDQRFHLTSRSVMTLFSQCRDLQCVGDLRFWSVSNEDRREIHRHLTQRHWLTRNEVSRRRVQNIVPN